MRSEERQEREQPASRALTRICLFFLTFFSLKSESMVTEERLPAVQREPCHVSELPVLCITEIQSPHCDVKKAIATELGLDHHPSTQEAEARGSSV